MKAHLETETLSTEQPERHSDASSWLLLALIFLFFIISEVLDRWLTKPFADGIAAFGVLLLTYRLNRDRKTGFLKWASGSLLLVGGYTGLTYVVFYALHSPMVQVLGTGVLVFVFFISIRFVETFFFGLKPDKGLGRWLAISAAAGLIGAFFAYMNPEGWRLD
ncbi:MAG TPA: hypothetical protein VNO50_09430 [Pyrinomonadaceae bacterium]|nr:hypothetical protein [Pyrinomonadaceae bacterium]